ncbi:helix-turn-helix domain-containing protein [bacterium]|nr:helix-turn-helix domain-containing protein [bacterium]
MKVLREKHGLTQKKLAALIEVTEGTVSAWELGRYKPTGVNLQRLKKALEHDLAFIPSDEGSSLATLEKLTVQLLERLSPLRVGSLEKTLVFSEGADHNSDPESLIVIPSWLAEKYTDIFGIRIKTRRLAPRIQPGDILFCTQSIPVRQGKLVVARLLSRFEVGYYNDETPNTISLLGATRKVKPLTGRPFTEIMSIAVAVRLIRDFEELGA